MTQADFIHIIENPYHIDDNHLDALQGIAEEFPYFQAAQAVLLKSFKNTGNYHYPELLKKVATLTSDRSVLFEFMTQTEFLQEFAVNEIKYLDETEDSKQELETIESDKTLPAAIENEAEIKADIASESEQKEQKESTALPKELNFEQWIKVLTSGLQHVENKENSVTKSNVVSSKFDRIDKFLNEKPKITPSRTTDLNLDIAKQSVAENDAIMTETLAKIYISQKKYKRAIKAYRILSLKYPEKSVFFANQIEAIKKIE